jgi:hypothetical protein
MGRTRSVYFSGIDYDNAARRRKVSAAAKGEFLGAFLNDANLKPFMHPLREGTIVVCCMQQLEIA